jgi:hypothetical protein
MAAFDGWQSKDKNEKLDALKEGIEDLSHKVGVVFAEMISIEARLNLQLAKLRKDI